MISPKELNPHNYPATTEIESNLAVLLERMNRVRGYYNVPMVVTSGLRSEELQSLLISEGKSNATRSKHLYGQACDIEDIDGKLWSWCTKNLVLLEEVGLWLEDKKYTPTWVHFQIVPPGSGHRIFIP